MEFKIRPLAVILILIGTVGIAAFAQQPLSPADLKSLLAQIRDKRTGAPDVEADFREEKTLHLMNKPITSVGHVWFEVSNKFRREVRGNSPSVTVSDGRELWIYYPNFKSAEHYSLGKHSPIDAAITGINTLLSLQNVENSFQVTASKTNTGYQLQLVPRSVALKQRIQSCNVQLNSDLHVSRTEMIEPNGDRITTSYSNHSRASVPPATFEFSAPPETQISTPLGR